MLEPSTGSAMAVGQGADAGAASALPPTRWREFRASYAKSRGALLGLALIVLLLFCAVFADVIAPHPPNEQYRDFTLTPPAWADGGSTRFLLGTDPVGRLTWLA